MTESIIVALITGGLAFLGVLCTNKSNHDKTINVMDTKIALIQKDISELEKKQDIIMVAVERVYGVEKAVELLDERTNYRISAIEREIMRFNDEHN